MIRALIKFSLFAVCYSGLDHFAATFRLEDQGLLLGDHCEGLGGEFVAHKLHEGHAFFGDVAHFDEAVVVLENFIEALTVHGLRQSLNEKNLVDA